MIECTINCEHAILIEECPICYPEFLSQTTVGEVLDNAVYGKSEEWRDAADKLLESLARENMYIVSDMLVIFLESAGYGLENYTPLGGVFKRASAKGLIRKLKTAKRQSLWLSKIYIKET